MKLNIVHSILLVLLFFVYSSPLIFINYVLFDNSLDEDIITGISMILSIGLIIITLNYVNRAKIKFNLKVLDYRLLIFLAFILILSDIAITNPGILLIETFIDNGDSINTNESYSYLLAAILIAPIVEEVLFRGIILKGLLENAKYSPNKGILISAILFSIIHFNFIQIFSSLSIGLLLGYYFYKTRSLTGAVLLHFIANMSILLCSYVNKTLGNSKITSISDIYGNYSIYIIGVPLVVVVFLIFKLVKNQRNIYD